MPRETNASHQAGIPALPPHSMAVSLPPPHSAAIRFQPHSPNPSIVQHERGSVSMILIDPSLTETETSLTLASDSDDETLS